MKKIRTLQHIMESQSITLLHELLPKGWVVHEYKPDYGIDFVIEIFNRRSSTKLESLQNYETLGEIFFVQLKSIKRVVVHEVEVRNRYNVEKKPLQWVGSEKTTVKIIKYRLDTSILQTVQAMGVALPVLLILVCLEEKRMFFLCLNDYIDKILIPEGDNHEAKRTCIVRIPILNEITTDPESHDPLRFYGKRAKLYAAFSKFLYQKDVFDHTDDLSFIKHFINTISKYDFWTNTPSWRALGYTYENIQRFKSLLASHCDEGDEALSLLHREAFTLWYQLTNLNNMYEEHCREWFLPTCMSNWSS